MVKSWLSRMIWSIRKAVAFAATRPDDGRSRSRRSISVRPSSSAALSSATIARRRAAESLRDEISMLGPVRLRDVETAQDTIIQAVRRLEEEGSISIDGGEGDVVA